MIVDPKYSRILEPLLPIFEVSLDPICVVDETGRIIYSDKAMRSFLGIPVREISKGVLFCNIVKLAACEPICQVKKLMKTGQRIHLSESAASRGDTKLRVQ